MKHSVISFSGGLGSAVSVLLAIENQLPYTAVFADTLIEDEDLYRFVDDIERVSGQPVVRLRDGRTPWDVFVDRKYIGNTRVAHCSTELKTKPIRKYVADNFEPSEVELILGMDYSEMDRIDRARKLWSPVWVDSLINRYKLWRPQWPEKLAEYGLALPRLYDLGYPHNNCGGFCVKAGLKQFATLLETMPDRYAKHEEEEQRVIAEIGETARPFLRSMTDKVTEYITLKTFRERYTAGTIKVSPFDYGGCGCFIDEDA